MRTAARNEFVSLVKRLDNFLVRLDEAIWDSPRLLRRVSRLMS